MYVQYVALSALNSREQLYVLFYEDQRELVNSTEKFGQI